MLQALSRSRSFLLAAGLGVGASALAVSIKPTVEYLDAWSQVSAWEKEVNAHDFQVGPTHRLLPEQVERFAQVQSHLREQLTAQDLTDLPSSADGPPQVGITSDAIAGLFREETQRLRALGHARHHLATGLNQAGFSVAEYRWVQARVMTLLEERNNDDGLHSMQLVLDEGAGRSNSESLIPDNAMELRWRQHWELGL